MTVNELIKYLSDFNPSAEVMYNFNGHEYQINKYAWDCVGGDRPDGEKRDIANEKLRATTVVFTSAASYNNTEK